MERVIYQPIIQSNDTLSHFLGFFVIFSIRDGFYMIECPCCPGSCYVNSCTTNSETTYILIYMKMYLSL